jgi:uncharacterized membrane protein YfcA
MGSAALAAALAEISVAELAVITTVAMFASVIGGIAGYGTGALMPLALVPIVGAEPVVPILSLAALFNNSSRATAFRHVIDWRRALLVLSTSLPGCALGAYGYTRLNGPGAALVIGGMMIASVPLRRFFKRRGLSLSDRGLAGAAAGWGVIVGGTTSGGIILLSLLMAVGLEGAAVVATDAAISFVIGLAKFTVFGLAGVVTAKVIVVALIIGCIAFPGAFLARALVERLPLHLHSAILDAVILAGGAVMIAGAFR